MAESGDVKAPPKVFISYAWTNADHQQWVVNLATALRGDGIEVVLDVWDLGPGQDLYKFMERAVTDASVSRVLLICNSGYSAKANNREGGVGHETQIITPELYGKAEVDKFVPVVAEREEHGEACVPAYAKSRIHVDLSSEQVYQEGYEKLLRLIHQAPAFPKPPLGTKPAFLNEEATTGSTTGPRQRRAIHALETEKRGAESMAREYCDAVAAEIGALRVPTYSDPIDEAVIDAIRRGKTFRDEFLALLRALCSHASPDAQTRVIYDFSLSSCGFAISRAAGHGKRSSSTPSASPPWSFFYT
jgi:hypothetical protein